MDGQQIVDAVLAQPLKDQRKLLRGLGIEGAFRPRARAIATEAAVDGDPQRAARVLGLDSKYAASLEDPEHPNHVLYTNKLKEHAERSKLTAEYVRRYILDVLELCPTDYFDIDADGDVTCDLAKFAQAPPEVKRLVDHVELKKLPRGEKVFVLKFVSKQAALALAARYTLVEKHDLNVRPTLPWEEIAGRVEEPDPIEQRLLSVTDGVAGSAEVREAGVA